MSHSRLACAALALASLCLAHPSLGGAAPAEATATIDNFSFSPTQIIITPGTTVTWTNRDDIPHTITGADASHLIKSEPLDTGDHFSYRFDHAGRFTYFCSLHAHMQGVVVVQ